MKRRSFFKPIGPPEKRFSDEAQRLRKQAHGTQPGFEREKLLRRARQAETASQIFQWLGSPGLKPRT